MVPPDCDVDLRNSKPRHTRPAPFRRPLRKASQLLLSLVALSLPLTLMQRHPDRLQAAERCRSTVFRAHLVGPTHFPRIPPPLPLAPRLIRLLARSEEHTSELQ